MNKFTNNARSSLAAALTPEGVNITVLPTDGARFPSLNEDGEYFLCTLIRADGTAREIVKVTSRTGDILTVTRAQEGTEAGDFPTGTYIALQATAATYNKVYEVDAKVVVYAETYDTADTVKATELAAGLADGATVIVDRDETQSNLKIRSTVVSNSLTNKIAVNNVFDDEATLLAHDGIEFAEGAILKTANEGFSYTVAASSADDFNDITAGGIKLYREVKPVSFHSQHLSYIEKEQARENIGATGRAVFGKRTVYSTAGTFTWERPVGCVGVKVTVVGSGGGSGGIAVSTGQGVSAGASAGEYVETVDLITTEIGLPDEVTVTVGAAGVGGAAGENGTDGEGSSFGAFVTAGGGVGSIGTTTTASTIITAGGALSTAGTALVPVLRVPGGMGGNSLVLSGTRLPLGAGGGNPLAASVACPTNNNAIAGRRYGGGASGASTSASERTGADGGVGIVIVDEYYSNAFSGFAFSPEEDQLMESLTWVRDTAPMLTMDAGTWYEENIYAGQIVRNLDRSPYQDGDDKFYMTFNGDDTEGTDWDRIGLASTLDFDTWTVLSVSDPIIDLGTPPAVDAGDAQAGNTWWDGSKFIMFYQGNATPTDDFSGDEVTLCKATATNIAGPWTKLGSILVQKPGRDGPTGDDLYAPKLVPVGHDGKPRIFYTEKLNGVLGAMVAVADTDIDGAWSRESPRHLFVDGITFLGDAWYADGLYHILYFPGGSPGGIKYAVSTDALNWAIRGIIIPRNIGEWDSAPAHPCWFTHDGAQYMIISTTSGVGIGKYTAT